MPDLAAPPTAPVQLSALLARRDLGLRQVAGPPAGEGGGAAVHWVHTSEMADPYPYLLGGELLLTAGVQLADDPDRYAARIVAAGGAALGFGLAPVYDTVPDALGAACDRHGLPLVEVPTRTPFTAVARAVWSLMAEARHHELRRVSQAQQGLAAAAARPDPVPAVLRQLATRLGGRAVLLAPDGTALQAAGREPEPGAREAREALAALARVVRPGAGAPGAGTPGAQPPPSPAPGAGPAGPRPAPTSATDTAGSAHLAAYAVAGGEGLVLGVATTSREPGDHTIAGVAVVLLSLLTAPGRAPMRRRARPRWSGCCSAPHPPTCRHCWARAPGRWCTPMARGPRPHSAARWWTRRPTPCASCCPPTARSPATPAGRSG